MKRPFVSGSKFKPFTSIKLVQPWKVPNQYGTLSALKKVKPVRFWHPRTTLEVKLSDEMLLKSKLGPCVKATQSLNALLKSVQPVVTGVSVAVICKNIHA